MKITRVRFPSSAPFPSNIVIMKYCSKCDTLKPLSEYSANKSSKSGTQSYCKPCNNKQFLDRRIKSRVWFQEYKSTLKCEECDYNHPAVLDFHHKDPAKKDLNVGFMVKNCYSLKTIQAEIAKCKVLCSNCHRILHWNERNVTDVL